MDTLDRSPARTAPSKRIENVGYTLVAVGYAVMTLGILEVGPGECCRKLSISPRSGASRRHPQPQDRRRSAAPGCGSNMERMTGIEPALNGRNAVHFNS